MGSNLRDIRKRIVSVEKTQQITRAMKMISAARLNRAITAVVTARPYADKMREVLGAVSSGLDPEAHPLLVRRTPVRHLEIVMFTSDRGLCGAFNSNIIKQVEGLIPRSSMRIEDLAMRREARELLAAGRVGETDVGVAAT